MALVVSTLGRTDELRQLFDSLSRQTFTDFELVLVDQNDDDRLSALAAADWPFPLRHVRTPGERGLSRGRNRGWRLARAEVILFPDDDCWYPPRFLETALLKMRAYRCQVLTGRAADETGRSINGRFETSAQPITRANIWTTGIEWVFFFRREVLEAVGGFDEGIGIGCATPWQAAEGQEILLRAMQAGYLCWFDPDLAGHHAEIVTSRPDRRARKKARSYARGMGYVLRRHHFGIASKAKWIVRPFGGALLSLARGRTAMAGYYAQVAMGRLEGAAGRVIGRT